jgi:Ca2+-binding RTX toxin-like protein
MDVAAAGGLLHADLGGTSIESDDFESLRLEPLAGQDTLRVHDLAATDVGQVAADLGVSAGGLPDGQADSVAVDARGAADNVAVAGGPPGIVVSGLAAGHSVLASDPVDRLAVNGLGGADTIDASGLAANAASLTLRGGADNDTLTGSAGNDTFAWEPGDGSDVVQGGGGTDSAAVGGSDLADTFAVAPAAARVSVTRGGDGTILDMDDVETASFTPRGAADLVTVPDMAGTDLTAARVDLGGDGQVDNVSVEGTAAGEIIPVTSDGSGVSVAGPSVKTTVVTGEPGTDSLTIRSLAGDDRIDASQIPANVIGLTLDGGLNTDQLFGSQGKDLFIGGPGDDLALMGAGDDTFRWSPGDGNDTVEGQDGSDTLLFNGAAVSEVFDISANGGRMRFTRNVGNIVMDCNDVERVDLNAFAGSDTFSMNDLTGTDVSQVNVALAAPGGGGDGALDTVIVNGTTGNDVVSLSGGPGVMNVAGLAATLAVTGGEPAVDNLNVGGNDTINASGVGVGAIRLGMDGGAGNDTLTGGAGDDTIFGGADVDLIHGGPGTDTLDGGGQPGDQVFQD